MAYDPSNPRRIRSQGKGVSAPTAPKPTGEGGGLLDKLRKKAADAAPKEGGGGFMSKFRKQDAPEPAAPQAEPETAAESSGWDIPPPPDLDAPAATGPSAPAAPPEPPAASGPPAAAAPPAAQPAPSPGGARQLGYDGTIGELYKIFLRNLLFNIVTLGLYHPWAKTNYRRYLWSRTYFDGDRFEYTGTGRELFKGMIIGSVLMVILYGGATAAIGTVSTMYGENAGILAGVGLFVVLGGFLTDLARYSARRYRYSRTVWRGVRLGVRGSAFRYGLFGLTQNLLTLATLGLYFPWAHSKKTARLTRDTTLGSEHLEYDGCGRGLVGPFLVTWLLFLPTFGLIMFYYMARSQRYIAAHTRLKGVAFAADTTFRNLFGLLYVNQLILSATFGLGVPLVLNRNMRYLVERHTLEGDVDFNAIQQGARQAAGDAEGLSEVLEVGDIGFG